jgi:ribonucleoside-diphosphate reductase alpha chain
VSTIIRLAGYRIKEMRPDQVELLSSGRLIVKDPEHLALFEKYPVLVMNGCRPRCAAFLAEELGKKRGSFPNFANSPLAKKYSAMRNATVTTVAPTGTLSIIAGCSSGIEPLFAIAFMRHVLEGKKLFEINPEFERAAKREGIYSAKLLESIVRSGSLQKLAVPRRFKQLYVVAGDIGPEWHVRMQAAFQKHTDNAVSKTVNFPQNAKPADVKKAYELAWKLKCKGITVYRYGSKPEQVLYIGETGKYVSAESEYSGGCPTKTCPSPS